MLADLLDQLGDARVFDLSQPYYVGMPHHPVHPPYIRGLAKAHGEIVLKDGASAAAESIGLGGHVGTHIDAIAHFSKDGKLHGGIEAASVQSYGGGVERHGVETIDPIVRRGVLLDAAKREGVDELTPDFTMDADYLRVLADEQETELRSGDVVLVRTGWASLWDSPSRYINRLHNPGPNLEGAQWLSSHGVFAGGSDTVAFEVVPSPAMAVHVHFLVENGIHILEMLNMEALSAAGVHEFAFIAAPLNLVGGTGAPIRPLAFA